MLEHKFSYILNNSGVQISASVTQYCMHLVFYVSLVNARLSSQCLSCKPFVNPTLIQQR